MIVYDTRSWLGSLGHWYGTVVPHILVPVSVVVLWTILVYTVQLELPSVVLNDSMGNVHKIMGSFTAFFLIFRSNQAYHRFWASCEVVKLTQVYCREIHLKFLVYMKGSMNVKGKPAEKAYDAIARQAKVDTTRYIMAYLVCFKLHARVNYEGYMMGSIDEEMKLQVDFDRARIRGLLMPEEFAIMDNLFNLNESQPFFQHGQKRYRMTNTGGCRPCHVLLFFLRCLVNRVSCAGQTWGWPERVLNIADVGLRNMMLAFEELDQNTSTPLPLPYCHLGKWMLAIYLLLYPLCQLVQDQGYVVNIAVVTLISCAMFGMEAISMEIEDPFGDDENDLEVMRNTQGIEDSLYQFMILKGDDSVAKFAWIVADPRYTKCNKFLCLDSEKGAVLTRMPEAQKLPQHLYPNMMQVHNEWNAARVSGTPGGPPLVPAAGNSMPNAEYKWVNISTDKDMGRRTGVKGRDMDVKLPAWSRTPT